ncbi:MAG: ComEC/Rec2 family competence protein, partial [Oscillospiraceae bacterium]
LGALGISALTVLFLNPYSAVNIGFLLSFFAVLGIIMFAKKIRRAICCLRFVKKHKLYSNILFDSSVEIFSISLAANIFTLPIQIFVFGRFAIATLIAGIPCILLSTPIIFLGLVSLLFACTPLKVLGVAVSYLVKPCAGLFLIIAKVCAVLPAIEFPSTMLYIYPLMIAFYSIGALLIIKKQKHLYKTAVLLGVMVFILAHTSYLMLESGTTHLFMQGDAILVMKDGKASVVGTVDNEYEANLLKQELYRNGIHKVEQLVIVAENTDDVYGSVVAAEVLNPKKIIAPISGRYSPHLEKVAQKRLMPLDGKTITLADNILVTPIRTNLGYETQFNINGKKLLKYQAGYGIIETTRKNDIILIPDRKPIIINETDKIKTVPLCEGKDLLIR